MDLIRFYKDLMGFYGICIVRRCCFSIKQRDFTIEYDWIIDFGGVEAIAKLLQISGLIYKCLVDISYI
jgi:hypothetical protein